MPSFLYLMTSPCLCPSLCVLTTLPIPCPLPFALSRAAVCRPRARYSNGSCFGTAPAASGERALGPASGSCFGTAPAASGERALGPALDPSAVYGAGTFLKNPFARAAAGPAEDPRRRTDITGKVAEQPSGPPAILRAAERWRPPKDIQSIAASPELSHLSFEELRAMSYAAPPPVEELLKGMHGACVIGGSSPGPSAVGGKQSTPLGVITLSGELEVIAGASASELRTCKPKSRESASVTAMVPVLLTDSPVAAIPNAEKGASAGVSFFWEVALSSFPSDACISVGFGCPGFAPSGSQTVGECPHSWALKLVNKMGEGGQGNVVAAAATDPAAEGKKRCRPGSPPPTLQLLLAAAFQGEVIGCLADMGKRQIRFYSNGKPLLGGDGTPLVLDDVPFVEGLFPVLSMGAGCGATLNLGERRFMPPGPQAQADATTVVWSVWDWMKNAEIAAQREGSSEVFPAPSFTFNPAPDPHGSVKGLLCFLLNSSTLAFRTYRWWQAIPAIRSTLRQT